MKLRQMAGAAMVATGLAACGVLSPMPKPTTLEERLAVFPTADLPLERDVTIYWNDRHVPFIEAESDSDLAFTLGLVHAHLRLGLMEIFRRASQGRLAEIGGPIATDIDHALRIVDFGKASAAIVAAMPPDSRLWLDRFVSGVNYYIDTVEELPHEFAVLGMSREPWTVEDIVTAGRLASADVNWFIWFSLLAQRERADWSDLWARLVEEGSESFPSYFAGESGRRAALVDILAGFGRSGSNSVAVSGQRSESGSAMLASDPHLGILQPSLWILAGYKSPSYHAVGLMGPGLPFVALGRNAQIAWGGTNLRAASSDLFDVSSLPESAFRSREERIKVRWWRDKTITVRDSEFGPVLSDAGVLETGPAGPLALRWIGHQPTDELTAMLRVNRASDWPSFREALSGFAVSSQNMLYADIDGNIGHLMATRLPVRPVTPPKDIVLSPDQAVHWDNQVTTDDLPATFNPANGVIASANNRGAKADVPIGYFFSPDDRVLRMTRYLEEQEAVDIDDLAALQQDAYQGSSVMMRDALIAEWDRLAPGLDVSSSVGAVADTVRAWDGHYAVDSAGALAFEVLLFHVVDALIDPEQQSAYSAAGRPLSFITDDLRQVGDERLGTALLLAMSAVQEKLEEGLRWGDLHRLRIAHPLGALPLLGRRYVFDDLPTAGSSQTVMKTAHDLTDERHNTSFGSNARHISDMADLDENYFVLLGGQDGWLGSSTFMDQIALWRQGEFVKMPMRLTTVRDTFPHVMELRPGP